MNKKDKVKLFINELNDIKDNDLRKFAERVIENAEDYFFTIAASTTGKYHPKFDLGDGGLMRHTRLVEYIAVCEATSRMYSEHDTDLLIIAALAHDIKKLGNNGSRHTVVSHPLIAAEYLEEMHEKYPKLISEEDLKKVCGAVKSHMGQWGNKDGLPLPKDDFEFALQAADYIASRKDWTGFEFRPTEEVKQIIVEEVSFKGKPKDYVLEFGKHRGKSIETIYKEGSDYLDWMISQEEFSNKEAQEMAKKYLASIKKAK
jgi:hypothetical protein